MIRVWMWMRLGTITRALAQHQADASASAFKLAQKCFERASRIAERVVARM